MKLNLLQNNFIDCLYSERQNVLTLIKDGKVPKEELLDIYRNNLQSTLINALRLMYPMTFDYLGETNFQEYAKKYILNNRSNSGNLDDYGYIFLQDSNNILLKDLATLELLKHKSYIASDCNIIDIQSLQNLEEDRLFNVKFKINPSCFLHSSRYNLLGKTNIDKQQNRTIYFIVYRQNLDVKVERISKSEYGFITGVVDNLTLYQIYEKYKPNIQKCLQRFISNGILYQFNC